ncbi:hypothetical protein EES42_12900 [Streptomyces sp. ADI95-17]|nr:hypothetical protein EES42_12900 [Streptomyces sp. ADI95-17]
MYAFPRVTRADAVDREAAGASSPSVAYATGVPMAGTARATAAAVNAVRLCGPVRPCAMVKRWMRGKAVTFFRAWGRGGDDG